MENRERGRADANDVKHAKASSTEKASREALPVELEVFLNGAQDPRTFRHADHVRVAFEMLRRHSFLSTARIFSRRLKQMAASVGKPQAYNETITIAFLAAISEQLAERRFVSFADFTAECPEMLDKSFLLQWYPPDQLNSDIARRTFVLPRSAVAKT
jgi:hypothetical protein